MFPLRWSQGKRLPSCIALASILVANPAVSSENVDDEAMLETVIVTASRSDQAGADLAIAWATLSEEVIARVAAQHSNQLFNRVSGAWVSRGNGQESLISLRSPVLTGAGSCGAFMTAQDGISLRAPGFCNVNQLFDANLLQAGRVEVLKGPAAVVFGSNALHGIKVCPRLRQSWTWILPRSATG